VLQRVGAGKITTKKKTKSHHAAAFTFAIWNRQALSLLAQIEPFLRSYKRRRAELVRRCYVRLTPRNGKYTPAMLAAKRQFEDDLLAVRARLPVRSADLAASAAEQRAE
jgi:hypothetical protein